MVLTDFVLSNNLVEEAKRVNRRRNVCSGPKKFGAQSSTTTKGNNSSAAAAEATRRPISTKDEEREESGVRGGDKEKEGTARGGMTSLKPKLEDVSKHIGKKQNGQRFQFWTIFQPLY